MITTEIAAYTFLERSFLWSQNRWAYVWEKSTPLQQLKRGGHIFKGGPIFGVVQMLIRNTLAKGSFSIIPWSSFVPRPHPFTRKRVWWPLSTFLVVPSQQSWFWTSQWNSAMSYIHGFMLVKYHNVIRIQKIKGCWLGTTKEAFNVHQILNFPYERMGDYHGDETIMEKIKWIL